MTRSIHRTRRELEEARHRDYSDPKLRSEMIEQFEGELKKKRRTKEQVHSERRLESVPSPTLPETIPIRVVDEGEFIHYPAGPEDILAVIRMLPKGVLDGIRSVELRLGKEHQLELEEIEGAKPDPFTGRLGYGDLPGVYHGISRGVYDPDSSDIWVLAYVYDPALPFREIWEPYLKLKMLATFVHEAAHHYDFSMRMARGRWLGENDTKVEFYADSNQYQWTHQCVVPYLEQAYPDEIRAFGDWIEHHGGIRLPLSMFVSEAGTLHEGQVIYTESAVFSVGSALEILIKDVTKGESRTSTRLEFARELHHGAHYPEALQVIDRVLSEHLDDPEALALQADIFVHQERYHDARPGVDRLLAEDSGDIEALMVLADIHDGMGEWAELESVTTRAMDLLDQDDWKWHTFLEHRIHARLEMEHWTGFQEDISRLPGIYGKLIKRRITRWLEEAESRKAKG